MFDMKLPLSLELFSNNVFFNDQQISSALSKVRFYCRKLKMMLTKFLLSKLITALLLINCVRHFLNGNSDRQRVPDTGGNGVPKFGASCLESPWVEGFGA